MTIHYLGPPKTFSERAALNFAAAGASAAPAPNLEAIARAIAGDASATGVLPYYNFLEGLIQESLDLISEYGLAIDGGVRVPIEFAAGVVAQAATPAVIYSHAKALAQCSDFIQKNYPKATIEPVSSTADAARRVRERGQGLAVSTRAALVDQGLTVLQDDIGNRRQGRANFTDFLRVVRTDGSGGEARAHARTIVSITPHVDRAGLLAEVLGQFAFYSLNIAKIHSRPAIDMVATAVEPQMFYLEVSCAPDSDELRRCRDALIYRFGTGPDDNSVFRLLGSFPLL